MTKEQKITVVRIITAAAAMAAGIIAEHTGIGQVWLVSLFAAVYIFIGYKVILEAFEGILKGEVFDENFLMLVASVAAFCIGEWAEGAAVMLFYEVGEFFEGYAARKSRRSIADMMDIVPRYANILENNTLTRIDPADVEVGAEIIVKAGERIPLDGVVVRGESFVDTSSLTGESVPKRVGAGDTVLSGFVNGEGTLTVRTACPFENSTVKKILELVENAAEKKTKTENFITRFAHFYTPAVTVCAVILALIPPLIDGNWGEWIRRACVFLVVSCPCALVMSVPLGFFGGIGAASKAGILVKGGNYLEAMSQMKTIVFDKTGTLTKGEFCVSRVVGVSCSSGELLETAALGESYSNHPVALSIRRAYGKETDITRVEGAEEIAGYGIKAVIEGKSVLLGSREFMEKNGVCCPGYQGAGTVIYVAREGELLGFLVISDTEKEGAKGVIEKLRSQGVRKCIMLSGDRRESAEEISGKLSLDEVYSQLLPSDKAEILEKIIEREKEGKTAFVGDGINDAPALSRADIGIAMGAMGTDAAAEAADIVIMDDDISKISTGITIARKTVGIVKENIVFSLGVKGLVLVLGALGLAGMWFAVAADVGVAVIAVLNSMRTQRI